GTRGSYVPGEGDSSTIHEKLSGAAHVGAVGKRAATARKTKCRSGGKRVRAVQRAAILDQEGARIDGDRAGILNAAIVRGQVLDRRVDAGGDGKRGSQPLAVDDG